MIFEKLSRGRLFGAALVAAIALGAAGVAQAACPPGLPPGVFCGGADLSLATAGTYAIDPNHAAVIAKVSHIGYSYSVFRFDKVAGTLSWDPAAPEGSKLSVSVDTGSIATNVPGFAAELSGDKFLKSAAFPKAIFVSSAFHRKDASHGTVTGDFTLMGVTAPLTFDVTMLGAGKGFGAPRLGVEATTSIDPKKFGMPPFFVDPIQLVIDVEFQRQP
jgi:polyisoprenoid-binding protein YceI